MRTKRAAPMMNALIIQVNHVEYDMIGMAGKSRELRNHVPGKLLKFWNLK